MSRESIDEAWAEAEAALPEGWVLAGVEADERLDDSPRAGKDWTRSVIGWKASAFSISFLSPARPTGRGDTPAAALLSLAEILRARTRA